MGKTGEIICTVKPKIRFFKIVLRHGKERLLNMKKKISLFVIFAAVLAVGLGFYLKFTDNVTAEVERNSGDLQLMARAVNGEARGEPYEGQVAVAAVILNRVKHSSFPNSVSGVIYQPGAFTAVSDGQINVPIASDSTVYKACQDAMNGWDPSGGAIYYFNPDTATSSWIWSRTLIKQIGKHRFCK